MTAAAMPQLTSAVAGAVAVGTIAVCSSIVVAIIAGALVELPPRQKMTAVVAGVLVATAIVVGVAALHYHAQWVDYRRSLP